MRKAYGMSDCVIECVLAVLTNAIVRVETGSADVTLTRSALGRSCLVRKTIAFCSQDLFAPNSF